MFPHMPPGSPQATSNIPHTPPVYLPKHMFFHVLNVNNTSSVWWAITFFGDQLDLDLLNVLRPPFCAPLLAKPGR